MHACDVHFCVGGKERRRTAFKWYMVPKRVVEVFLSDFFFFFGFWFLVFGFRFFYCRVTRVARGVFCGHWVGLGLYTTWGESLPSTGLQVHVTFLLMRWQEEGWKGMEGWYRKDRKGGGVRTLFCWKIENRQKSATVGPGCLVFCFL